MLPSPIYFDKCRGVHIDLSQLAEVGPIFGIPLDGHIYNQGDPLAWVGFSYRFGISHEPLFYRRPLRKGPDRHEDLTLVNPSATLQTVGEEYYSVVAPHRTINSYFEHKSHVLVHSERHDVPVVERNLESERMRLINAWTKWKKIEPEIYAIIRKHMD